MVRMNMMQVWTMVLVLCLRLNAQRLVFLNSTDCLTVPENNCFSNNVLGHYLALDLEVGSQGIPSFSLARDEMVEILWELPTVPLRFLGISTYVNTLSSGEMVFAEVAPAWDQVQIATACQLTSIDLLWGSVVRIVLSPAMDILEHRDGLCTLLLPVAGNPYTNLTESPLCQRENHTILPTPTRFSVLFRLTLPQNETELDQYVRNIDSKTKIERRSILKEAFCSAKVFGYPETVPRPNVTGEVYDQVTIHHLQLLLSKVVETIINLEPQADIRLTGTIPWIPDGFTCINKSVTCQGSTQKSTYEHSEVLSLTSWNTKVIVVGCIHNDFLNTSFYSSMSLYKLADSSDLTSGIGVSSVVDSEQRSSATGFLPGIINMDHFFVMQWGYSCLNLSSNALCRTFTSDMIDIGESIFVIGRTYANPAGPLSDSLLRDIVLLVQY